jgi:alpha-L-rhamnosidase
MAITCCRLVHWQAIIRVHLDNIREYWGSMLDLGATTFWEDFNVEWMKNAARIDELTPEGKVDVHGAYGDYCYVSYRHSLCHGWASGPTAWLTEHVLGVKVLEPGGRRIKLDPHLGDLEWVEGTFPTSLGALEVKHRKLANGKVETTYKAPRGVKIVKK